MTTIPKNTPFKMDYSNVTVDEHLNKYRQSKVINMKNLSVTNELSVGDIRINKSHITTTGKKDPVIYFDDQVNILQSAYTEDSDVINTEKNTSFVNYRNLSNTYYMKVGGYRDENVFKNNKCVDANNNLYVILASYSSSADVFDSTNIEIPVADLQVAEVVEEEEINSQNIVIVKYNHLGEYQWSTRISGFYDKYYPSLVCDNDGNIVVCFGNDDIGNQYDISIYDTSSNTEPVEQITDLPTDSSIIVKYDTNGLFLWSVHVNGVYSNDYIFLPRISCDVNGNVFLSHALRGRRLQIYDKTPEEYVPRPDDFFCVILNHFHTGHVKYTQPIYEYNTGLSSVNFVTMKFDKDGKFKWINHVEMANTTDESQRCFVDNDIEGNVILSGNFQGLLKVFNPLNKTNIPDEKLTYDTRGDGDDNIFLIKFDTNGSVIWCTKVVSDDDDSSDVNTIIDSNCNIYLSFESQDERTYLYDTENKTSEKYDFVLKEGYRSLVIVKYDKEGVIKWFTAVDGFDGKYEPCLAIDNRFIRGNENSNIYLSGSYYGKLNFYNSTDIKHIAYTLAEKEYDGEDEESIFIACYDQDGILSWATKAATAPNSTGNDTYDATIVADKDGHVYLMGEYEGLLNIYDAQHNDKPVATLTIDEQDNNYDDDVFIIKYNRYGLLNTSNPKLLYIEDNADLPDSFCKEVILTNNDNNGVVNLQIMKKENYGYSVRRNVLITEVIELITKDGIWIPKIISDQYEYVNDLDVIDTNTKTSFVNYQNLQNTFYTKIGGEGYEVNPQIHLDKNDNVYMAGVYDSDEVSIYDFTNQNVPVGSLQLDGEQSLFITKYDSAGVNQWYTRVGGYYAKEEPSIFVNGNGDVFVVMQSYEGGEESINIYDVNNVQYPAKTLSEYSETNTVLLKYNSKGEFQWNIRMKAFTLENESFTSTACVTGDLEGNLFVSGYFDSETISIYDTGSDETPCKTFNRFLDGEYACYFICKFDYRGKFTWLNHLEGGFVPNNHIAPPDYIKFFRINLNTDSLGNLYLTSSFYSQVFIYNPDGDEPENIIFGGNDGTGLFTVKYNSMGIYQWNTGIFTEADTDEGPDFLTGAVEAGSCVDADGNLYVCFSNLYVYNYGIFDTRKSSAQPVYTYENESLKDSFVSVVKFNHRGVYQWNNFVKVNDNQYDFDITISPVITCDNQYIIGQNNPNIYIHFNGFIDDYRGGFNFYNAKSNLNIAYTLPSKDYWIDNTTTHSILAKYDSDGNFQWATTAAGYSEIEEGNITGILPACVRADRTGHVYISGSHYSTDIEIWDVSTNGHNDEPVAVLNNTGNMDCFLIKYNRYGLINNNIHCDIYLEDVPNMPNAFEKSIVITNNTNNGPVNCQILEPLSSGFGYSVRRNITLTDCLDLVSHDGKWIPKVQTEQISISNDLDISYVNTKLSILDYDDLNDASWMTRIAGDGDERNVRLSTDKYNNLYVLFSFDSATVYFEHFSNNSDDSIPKSSTYRDIGLAKYLANGNIQWISRIGFDSNSNFAGKPNIYTDAEGNSYVTIVKTDDEATTNILIYDTKNPDSSPMKTVSLTNSGTIVIKYDKEGLYLWDVRIKGRSANEGTNGSNAVADKNGNVYITGFILDSTGVEIWDTSDSVSDEITVGDAVFVVKFDKTGKYLWRTYISDGIETDPGDGVETSNDNIALSCDNDGNVIVSATQNGTVSVYERLQNNTTRYLKDITKVPNSALSLFTVKYDTNGKCLWTNRLGSNSGDGSSGQIFQPNSTIDSYGNYYLSAQISGASAYIYDTRNEDDIRFNIGIPSTGTTYNTFFAKYNKNGIIQWYSFVSGYSSGPSICVDNRFIQGISENSVYLAGSYLGENEGTISLYNSGQNGDSPSSYANLSASIKTSYLVKYNTDGYLMWCSKVSGSNQDMNNSVAATGDGHVYLGGEFNTDFVNVYQGWTLGMDPNADVAGQINNYSEGETYDIFLVKYNRYGIINDGTQRFGKELYLENNAYIPNGTEKSIVIINNNENNGYRENVCLMILQKNIYNGFSSFRNVWFSEGVSLISYDGQWFIKSSSGDTLPKRSIIMWGGDQSNIPKGWRLCDGNSLNGVTTPDLRGRFILGYNNGVENGVNGSSINGGNTNLDTGARVGEELSGVVGKIGGEVLHSLTVNEMPSHNHGVTDPGHVHSVYQNTNNQNTDNAFATQTAADDLDILANTGTNTTGITINNTGGSLPHNNLPPFYVLAYIMKCF